MEYTNKFSKSICTLPFDEQNTLSDIDNSLQCLVETSSRSMDDVKIYSDLDAVMATHGINTFTNVAISKSKNVHLGNVININSPICFNNDVRTTNKYIAFPKSPLSIPIIPRTHWLAQPPSLEYDYMKEPAKYVIISHSATERGTTQPENVLLVRLIQQFHMESRCWNDIAYNFLVGADGNIYEGRGWKAIGAHTFRYNRFAIGICFIGCYSQNVPPEIAIRNATRLIELGVTMNYIDKNYKLLGHCQCSSTESPGATFYENVKTWDHWDSEISVHTPSELIYR